MTFEQGDPGDEHVDRQQTDFYDPEVWSTIGHWEALKAVMREVEIEEVSPDIELAD